VRSFDAGRSCVSFCGSDTSLEIAFQIEIEALRTLAPGGNEAQLLATFDNNRDAILKMASVAYARRKASHHRITAADISSKG
jgi:hypothetical protein